jgi:hypothetical protein
MLYSTLNKELFFHTVGSLTVIRFIMMMKIFTIFVLLLEKHLIRQNARHLLILRILIRLHTGRILGNYSSPFE